MMSSMFRICMLITRESFSSSTLLFFFNDTATTEIYTLSLHDALPISRQPDLREPATSVHLVAASLSASYRPGVRMRSEEHTSELQSQSNLVCRLLLEKKNTPGKLANILIQTPCRAGLHARARRRGGLA